MTRFRLKTNNGKTVAGGYYTDKQKQYSGQPHGYYALLLVVIEVQAHVNTTQSLDLHRFLNPFTSGLRLFANSTQCEYELFEQTTKFPLIF